MPDEPTSGPTLARRRRRLPPRANALVVIAFTLFVVSGVVYAQSIPSLLTTGDQGETTAERDENPAETDREPSGVAEDAAEQDAQNEPTTEQGASSEEGAQPEKVQLPDVSLQGTHVEEEPSSPDTEDPEPDAPAPENPKPPANDEPVEDTGDGTPDNDAGAGGDVITSTPSAEEEAAFHAFLVGKASAIPDYVSQANACASTFESTCQSASLSSRRVNRDSCAALTQQLVSEYVAVRDYVRSNDSQYCDEQGRLIGAYRCLTSYVDCYLNAWTANVSFEDPSGHVGEFTAPLAGCDGFLAEFHSYYDGLVI